MANLGQKIIANFANDNAKFLFITAAIGWFLASAAQTFGIIVNKDIDKKDKKFLIPQEILDGAVNIGLYALITAPLIKNTEKLIDKGIISFTNVQKNTPKFDNIKGGARVLASFAGAVLSCNIITPIIRNKLGGIATHRKEMYQKINMDEFKYNPYYQPFFKKNIDKQPLNISNYVSFSKNHGMKI